MTLLWGASSCCSGFTARSQRADSVLAAMIAFKIFLTYFSYFEQPYFANIHSTSFLIGHFILVFSLHLLYCKNLKRYNRWDLYTIIQQQFYKTKIKTKQPCVHLTLHGIWTHANYFTCHPLSVHWTQTMVIVQNTDYSLRFSQYYRIHLTFFEILPLLIKALFIALMFFFRSSSECIKTWGYNSIFTLLSSWIADTDQMESGNQLLFYFLNRPLKKFCCI